jgi:transposase
VDLREVLNAIRYMARSAGGWRMLPVHFGPWQTIYWWFRRFVRKRGVEARLPSRAMDVLGRPGAGSFEPTSWSTLMTTRRLAGIAALRF